MRASNPAPYCAATMSDAGREIADHLYELGHRRIAFVGGPERESLDSQQRYEGLEKEPGDRAQGQARRRAM